MKKLLLIALLATYFLTSFSQDRIGYTEQEIRDEFSNYNFHVYYSDGLKNIGAIDYEISIAIIYYFDENGICNKCMLAPLDDVTLRVYINVYNENYIVISDTEWKKYHNNGIKHVELIFLERPTFIITKKLFIHGITKKK